LGAVTVPVFQSIAAGIAASSVLARSVGASLELIDVGINLPTCPVPLRHTCPSVTVAHHRVSNGTRDISKEAAMAPQELEAALAVGRGALERAALDGVHVICVGEIGIGNTTSAAALLAGLTGSFSVYVFCASSTA
jgi:nicotinate-nucleotide--dimethylbenzimidazole phosphoribosyltransferase